METENGRNINLPREENYPLLLPKNIHSKSNLTSNVYATRLHHGTGKWREMGGWGCGQQKCRCIWGTHELGETDRQTDWPGEKRVKRDGGEPINNKKGRRGSGSYLLHTLLHVFILSAHPHTETERSARHSRPCMQKSFSRE